MNRTAEDYRWATLSWTIIGAGVWIFVGPEWAIIPAMVVGFCIARQADADE